MLARRAPMLKLQRKHKRRRGELGVGGWMFEVGGWMLEVVLKIGNAFLSCTAK